MRYAYRRSKVVVFTNSYAKSITEICLKELGYDFTTAYRSLLDYGGLVSAADVSKIEKIQSIITYVAACTFSLSIEFEDAEEALKKLRSLQDRLLRGTKPIFFFERTQDNEDDFMHSIWLFTIDEKAPDWSNFIHNKELRDKYMAITIKRDRPKYEAKQKAVEDKYRKAKSDAKDYTHSYKQYSQLCSDIDIDRKSELEALREEYRGGSKNERYNIDLDLLSKNKLPFGTKTDILSWIRDIEENSISLPESLLQAYDECCEYKKKKGKVTTDDKKLARINRNQLLTEINRFFSAYQEN